MKTKETTRQRKAERDVITDLQDEFELVAVDDFDVIDELAFAELEDE